MNIKFNPIYNHTIIFKIQLKTHTIFIMRNEISLCLESVTILKYGYILQFIALNDTFVVCALFYNIVISKNITCLLSLQKNFALVNSLVSAITTYSAFLQYVCHDNLCNSSFLVFTLS